MALAERLAISGEASDSHQLGLVGNVEEGQGSHTMLLALSLCLKRPG
jgi:hypothetical protein